MLVVRCPRCGHDQNYNPGPGLLSGKVKRCVFCGFSFKVHSSFDSSRIIKTL